MTPEAQRIAIAEACGIKDHGNRDGYFRFSDSKGFNCSSIYGLPDYLNDLNAMHEAEKVLKNEQRETYWEILCLTVPLSGDNSTNAWSATASQRAEAFLRTLGLWKE